MGWLFFALFTGVAVAVSAVWDRPASATAAAGRFRVVTYNIQKGANREGRYDLERTIATLARFDADLIGVQEAMRNDAAFDCDDQPALIAAGLRRITGHAWTHVYAKAWITRNRECVNGRKGDEVATEGLALFAPTRITGVTALRLSPGRVALTARLPSFPGMSVAVTHLSAGQQSQPEREREIELLLPWAGRQRAAILMGDFNALPQAIELTRVTARYQDAWAAAAGRGLANGVESGATRAGRRGSRIDYVFYAAGAGLALESVEVVDTSTPEGLPEASDHRPVVATFRRDRGLRP